MLACFVRLLLLALLAVPAAADDFPVAGARLLLSGHAYKPRVHASVVLRGASIEAGLVDPTVTGAALRIDGGAEAGRCSTEVRLPAWGWSALGRSGVRGFVFHGRRRRPGSIRMAFLVRSAIYVVADTKRFRCALDAPLGEPVRAEFEAGDTRWCAAFGGQVAASEPGRFVAHDAPPPAACAGGAQGVTAASLNILHGVQCPTSTQFCRFDDRLQLLFQWIEHEGCPDVVTLQEVSIGGAPVIEQGLAALCEGAYQPVYVGDNLIDDQMHLVRHPVLAAESRTLYRKFRTALFTRLDHPVGPLDVFSTHLASTRDNATHPCAAADCPPECVAAGAATVRDCQAVQFARFVEERHDVPGPALVSGDLNEVPGSFVYQQFASRGWADAYLEAGLPECDPATGEGCTSGRADGDLSQLESPASNQERRIDFLFVVPPESGACRIDPDFTRIFTDHPNPFAPSCGPAPLPICWPSDHEGMQVGLECWAEGFALSHR